MNKLDKDLENEIDENTLAFARHFKKKLRFDIADVVYLKSDLTQTTPLTISLIECFSKDYDYVCIYIHPKKGTIIRDFFVDKVLTTKIQ